MKLFGLAALLLIPFCAFAQQPQQQSPEEQEKQLYEAIQQQVDKMADDLDLEDWQTFYVDSILTHDYNAMRTELEAMSMAKFSNNDGYVAVSDKWMEQIDNAYRKIFTDKQWAKYMKLGGEREKKARDKRAKERNR